MDTPFYLHPAFIGLVVTNLLTGVAAIVAFTIWLIRLESSTKANATATENLRKALVERLDNKREKITKIDHEMQELWDRFDAHQTKENIHFNERVGRQVEEKYNQRFQTIENTLGKMDEKIEKKFDLLNSKLDAALKK